MTQATLTPPAATQGQAHTGSLKFKHYTPAPGHPFWPEVHAEAMALVKEAEAVLDLAPPTAAEVAKDALRKFDALKTTTLTMADNRRRQKQGEGDLVPAFFIWTMHNTCNFRCDYCDNHQGEKYFHLSNQGRLDTPKCKALLDVMKPTTRGIYFCGGEPTLRKDLAELTTYAHEQNFYPLLINTNGSRLHKMFTDPAFAKWLKQMDVIIVSLDGLSLPMLEKLWGVKQDAVRQVFVNLLALRELAARTGTKVIVNTVITPDTLAEAEAVMNFADDLGLWFSPVPVNHGPTVEDSLLHHPGYQALARTILQRKKDGRKMLGSYKLLKKLLFAEPLVCHPTLKPHVDIDGQLYWPCKTASAIEPLKLNLLEYDSLKSAYAAANKMRNVAGIHGPGPEQCQAQCNWMQNYVSDRIASGLAQPLQSGLLGEALEFAGVR